MEELNKKLKEQQAPSSQDANQIHVDKQVNAEDKFWIRWEKRRREELQETLQSIERELQEKQLDMQSYRENLTEAYRIRR